MGSRARRRLTSSRNARELVGVERPLGVDDELDARLPEGPAEQQLRVEARAVDARARGSRPSPSAARSRWSTPAVATPALGATRSAQACAREAARAPRLGARLRRPGDRRSELVATRGARGLEAHDEDRARVRRAHEAPGGVALGAERDARAVDVDDRQPGVAIVRAHRRDHVELDRVRAVDAHLRRRERARARRRASRRGFADRAPGSRAGGATRRSRRRSRSSGRRRTGGRSSRRRAGRPPPSSSS